MYDSVLKISYYYGSHAADCHINKMINIVKFAIALSPLVGLKMGTTSIITRSLWLLSLK